MAILKLVYPDESCRDTPIPDSMVNDFLKIRARYNFLIYSNNEFVTNRFLGKESALYEIVQCLYEEEINTVTIWIENV